MEGCASKRECRSVRERKKERGMMDKEGKVRIKMSWCWVLGRVFYLCLLCCIVLRCLLLAHNLPSQKPTRKTQTTYPLYPIPSIPSFPPLPSPPIPLSLPNPTQPRQPPYLAHLLTPTPYPHPSILARSQEPRRTLARLGRYCQGSRVEKGVRERGSRVKGGVVGKGLRDETVGGKKGWDRG